DLQNLRHDLQPASRTCDKLVSYHWRTIPLLPVFLGRQHVRDLSRHRNHPLAAEHQSAAAHCTRIGAAVVGVARGGRLRADSVATVGVRRGPAESRTILDLLFPSTHRHGWFLGDALT